MIRRRFLSSSSSRIAQRPHVVCIVAAFSADGPVGFHERLLQAGRVPVSASDGFQFQISVSTLCSSASVLGDAAIGCAHTHLGTDLFSSAALKAGRDRYRRTNRPTMPLDIEVFVGLTDGRM